MNNDIQQSISLTYEIEGLLHLIEHRRFQEVPQSVRRLLAQKSAALAALLGQEATFDEPVENVRPAAPVTTDEQQVAETVAYEQDEDSRPDPSSPSDEETKLDEAQAEEDEADTEAAEAQDDREKYYGEIAKKRSAGTVILQGFTVNDRYLFAKELFHGSSTAFNVIIDEISTLPDIEAAKKYLSEKQGINLESQAAKDFIAKLASAFK